MQFTPCSELQLIGLEQEGASPLMATVFSPQIQQFSKKEIEDLLRKGAYAAIMEEDDEGSKFCEEDIDQILLRRTTTITIESEGKGSTFAKVSYLLCYCFIIKCDGRNLRAL